MQNNFTKQMIVEFERVNITCRRPREIINYCRECRTETSFVTIAEAARMIRASIQTIFKLTEADILHSFPAQNGELHICLAALVTFEKNRFR